MSWHLHKTITLSSNQSIYIIHRFLYGQYNNQLSAQISLFKYWTLIKISFSERTPLRRMLCAHVQDILFSRLWYICELNSGFFKYIYSGQDYSTNLFFLLTRQMAEYNNEPRTMSSEYVFLGNHPGRINKNAILCIWKIPMTLQMLHFCKLPLCQQIEPNSSAHNKLLLLI